MADDVYNRAQYKKSPITTDAEPEADLSAIYATIQSLSLKQDKATTLEGYNIADAYIDPSQDGQTDSVTITLGPRSAVVCTYSFAQELEGIAVKALKYQGTWSNSSALPASGAHGDTYISTVSGSYNNGRIKTEVGDLLVCRKQGSSIQWDVIQGNIDGAVTATTGNTVRHIAIFQQGGYSITDGGHSVDDLVTSENEGSGTNLLVMNGKQINELTNLSVSDITDLQDTVADNSTAITSLQTTVSTNSSDIDTVSRKVTSVESRLTTAESAISTNAERIGSNDTSGSILYFLNNSEGNFQRLSSSVTSLNSTVTSLSQSLGSLTSDVDAVEEDVSDLNTELSTLKGAVSSLQTTHTNDVNTINSTLDSIGGRVTTLEGEFTSESVQLNETG